MKKKINSKYLEKEVDATKPSLNSSVSCYLDIFNF